MNYAVKLFRRGAYVDDPDAHFQTVIRPLPSSTYSILLLLDTTVCNRCTEEAARITDIVVAPGNILNVGGNVRIGREGRLAVTVRNDSDYTRVKAAGGLALDGELVLDVQGPLTQGTVLAIMTGGSVTGRFDKLPENRAWQTGGYLFRVPYWGNTVTLTVMHAVPPTSPPGQN